MGGPRKLLGVLVLLACAALLAACGGSGGDSTATQTEASRPAEGGAEGGGEKGSAHGSNGKGSSGAGRGSEGGGRSSGGGSSGGGGNASGSHERSARFKVQGGDNSIQEFGSEGGASQRSKAEVAIEALYDAYRSGNWQLICSKYLSSANLEEIKGIAEQSPKLKGSSCAEVLGESLQAGGQRTPDTPAGKVASIRIKGEVAFALFRGIDGKGYAIPLRLEGGHWKLTALAPTPLEF